jgi:integrase
MGTLFPNILFSPSTFLDLKNGRNGRNGDKNPARGRPGKTNAANISAMWGRAHYAAQLSFHRLRHTSVTMLKKKQASQRRCDGTDRP